MVFLEANLLAHNYVNSTALDRLQWPNSLMTTSLEHFIDFFASSGGYPNFSRGHAPRRVYVRIPSIDAMAMYQHLSCWIYVLKNIKL